MNLLPDDPPRLAPTLRRVWHGMNQTFRRAIAHSGITPDQFTVLRWLSEHNNGLTQIQLLNLMASDANTIASLLMRMEKAKLVIRRKDPNDARCNVVTLLPAGQSLRTRLQSIALELQERILGGIPAAARPAFLRQLALLADTCAQEAPAFLDEIAAGRRRRGATALRKRA